MNLQVMFRTQYEEYPPLEMNLEQVEQFYKKIIQLRGTFKKSNNLGSIYLGMRLSSDEEEWSIFREFISVISKDEKARSLCFIDENREIESWLFENIKPHLNTADINIITSDLDEVLSRNFAECHYG